MQEKVSNLVPRIAGCTAALSGPAPSRTAEMEARLHVHTRLSCVINGSWADIRSCPLFPRNRAFTRQGAVSRMCHSLTIDGSSESSHRLRSGRATEGSNRGDAITYIERLFVTGAAEEARQPSWSRKSRYLMMRGFAVRSNFSLSAL